MNLTQLYDDLYTSNYHNDNTCHTTSIIKNDIIKYVPRGSKILDVGCSIGNALYMMTGLGYKPTGVDISNVAISKCIARGFSARVGTTYDTRLPDNCVDALTCTDVLEHVPRDLVNKSILEFCRVVKPGGYIFLQIATGVEKNRKFDSITRRHGLDNLHITCMSQDSWVNIFNTWDLVIEKNISQGFKNESFQVNLINNISDQKLNYFLKRL